MTEMIVFDFVNGRVGIIGSNGDVHEAPEVIEIRETAPATTP